MDIVKAIFFFKRNIFEKFEFARNLKVISKNYSECFHVFIVKIILY